MKIKIRVLRVGIIVAGMGFGLVAHSNETPVEKVETFANKATDSLKKAYRKSKEKTCEMVNGKLDCVAKKLKNKADNLSDKISTSTKEAANKVD